MSPRGKYGRGVDVTRCLSCSSCRSFRCNGDGRGDFVRRSCCDGGEAFRRRDELGVVCRGSFNTDPGGRRGLPGVCTASGRDDERVFLGLRTVEGGITSEESFLGKSLSPESWVSLKCDIGEEDTSQDDANDTRGIGASRKISDPDRAASNEECSDVTAEDRSNSSSPSTSPSPSFVSRRPVFIVSSALLVLRIKELVSLLRKGVAIESRVSKCGWLAIVVVIEII